MLYSPQSSLVGHCHETGRQRPPSKFSVSLGEQESYILLFLLLVSYVDVSYVAVPTVFLFGGDSTLAA